MKRADGYRLQRILETGRLLSHLLSEEAIDRERLLDDYKVQWLVSTPLYNIGEQVYCLSRELKDRYADIPWSGVAGLRHRLVHDYEGTDWHLVSRIVFDELPEFLAEVEKVADREACRLSTEGFVGVFDSGVGGISVLKSLVEELSHEDFHYFGDSANAPYGEKSPEKILSLCTDIVERFLADGAKAIVIACNTATSVAAASLRAAYPNVPIIGIEPALKPAATADDHGRILVMATDVTLTLDKYHELARAYGQDAEVISVPCPGLAGRIELGDLEAADLREMINSYVGSYRGTVGSVVLGCTHYPFVRAQIAEVLGPDVRFFDGGAGTARQLRARLTAEGLLAERERAGKVEFASSLDTPEELALYEEFFSRDL